MTTRFSALTRFNTAGCSARPTARTLRAPASARVRRRSRRPRVAARARVRFGARAGPSVRAGGSRARSGPRRCRTPGSASSEGADSKGRTDRDAIVDPAGRSRARGSLPFLAAMRRFRAVPSSSSAREKRAADSKPVSGRATPTSVLDQHPPVHAEPAGHAKRFRGRRRALALVHVRGPLALRGPRLGARARLLAPAREPRVGDRARGGAPRPRGVPRRPGDGRRARAMRLARLPPPRRPPRRRHPGDAQGRARRRDRREIRRRRAASGGEPARA